MFMKDGAILEEWLALADTCKRGGHYVLSGISRNDSIVVSSMRPDNRRLSFVQLKDEHRGIKSLFSAMQVDAYKIHASMPQAALHHCTVV